MLRTKVKNNINKLLGWLVEPLKPFADYKNPDSLMGSNKNNEKKNSKKPLRTAF